ncbi:MAG: methyl-accepting chemotaxis protein [Parachlamydiales bacterium]|jgi:methyl-accepting chemotaxis protein
MSSIALLLNKLQQRFTYRQRFLFFAAVFFIATPLPDYWVVKEYNALIAFKKHQINGLDYYRQVLKLRRSFTGGMDNPNTLNIHSAIAKEFAELDKSSPQFQHIEDKSYWDEFNFYAPLYPRLSKILALFHEYLAALTNTGIKAKEDDLRNINGKLDGEFFHLAFLTGLLSDPTLPFPNVLNLMLALNFEPIQPAALERDYDSIQRAFPEFKHNIEKIRYLNSETSEEWSKQSFILFDNILKKQLRSYEWLNTFFLFLLLLVTTSVILFVFMRILTRHLMKLLDHIEALSKGDFSTRYYPTSDDEFSQVGLTLNNMANALADMAGRIHSLGSTLTSSSEHLTYEVTTHETSVLDQESSIHATETIANKIATDCRNFMKTINDLSNNAMQQPLTQNTQKNLSSLRQTIEEICIDTYATLNTIQDIRKELLHAASHIPQLEKISEEAHMLGLNASIEANSRGQHHSQFYKSTQAIEQFTERTSHATHHIDAILKEISLLIVEAESKIHHCSDELEQGKDELRMIHNQLHGIDKQVVAQMDEFEKLNNALKKQAFEAENIIDAITHVRKNANHTKGIFLQLHHKVLHLGESTRELRHLLEVFFSEPNANTMYKEGRDRNGN